MKEIFRKYSVIVFDLGNVIVPFDYNIAIGKLNKIENKLGDKFYSYFKSHYEFHRQHERGDITSEQFIEQLINELGHKLDSETFIDIIGAIFRVNVEVVALLPELKKKYTLVILSNTNLIHMNYVTRNYTFIPYFDKLVLSHEVKAVKPEPAIYKAVENFTQKPPHEHIFIDDIAEYAEAAKKMGWDAIQFINPQQLIRELKQRNII